MWFAGISMLANVLGSFALFYWFKSGEDWMPMPHVGIALATSIAGWVNVLLLWRTLANTRAFVWDRKLIWNLVVILLASLLMGAVLLMILPYIVQLFISPGLVMLRIIGLCILVASGACVFFVPVVLMGQFRFRQLLWREQ